MSTTDGNSTAQAESLTGRLPIPADMRVYKTWWPWIAAAFSYAAATWGLLTGGVLGTFLDAPQSITAFMLGQGAALVLCSAYLGVVSGKFGIDTVDAAKPVFGIRGSFLVLALVIAIMVGWILVLVALTGNAMQQFASNVLGVDESRAVLGILSLSMLALCVAIASTGPRIFAKVYELLAPLHLVLLAVLAVILLSEFGLSDLWHIQPPAETALPGRAGFALALELGFGYGFGFWISLGALFRLVSTQRMAIHGGMVGWGALAVPSVLIAVFSGLATGSDNPTVWMYELAGDWGGTAAIALIFLANVSSTVMMLYIAGIAVKQARIVSRVRFPVVLTVLALPGVWVAFWPERLFEWYPTFLYYNGVLIAPVVCVLTVDFFLLRRQRIELAEIFTWKRTSKYWFWGGVNPVAIGIVLLGFGFYNLLYNPVTGEYESAFTWLTASLPTAVLCSVGYYLVMRVVVIPRGVGGYPTQARHPVAAERADGRLADVSL